MNRPDKERELAQQWIKSGEELDAAELSNAEHKLTTTAQTA